MFDPNFIGNVSAEDVQVEEILPGYHHFQRFRAVVTLQGHRHRLLLKPNPSGERDQIVADRLKYLFDMKPMHVFGLRLNFLFRGGKRVVCDWIEYLAISLGPRGPRHLINLPSHMKDERLRTLREIRRTDLIKVFDFQVELCKAVIFRYVIGTSETCDEHILIHTVEYLEGDLPPAFEVISISESVITSQCPPRDFLDSLRFISSEAWRKAQEEILASFDFDYERGIILQTRQPERDLKHRKPKGPLHVKATRIAEIIEDRLTLITECDVNEILRLMH